MNYYLIFSFFIFLLATACNNSDAENSTVDEANNPATQSDATVSQVQDNNNDSMDEPVKTNLEKAEEFLADNKTKEGVMSTESGLQ